MTPCVEWGRARRNGYGVAWHEGRVQYVHRLVFEAIYGWLPEVVRHRCDNPACFRIDHLEGGTKADNSRDMVERGRQRGGVPRRQHCAFGHPDSELHVRGDGRVSCRACRRARRRPGT